MLQDQYVSNDDCTLWDDSGYSDYPSYNMLTDQCTEDECGMFSDEDELDLDNLNC